MDRRFVRGYRGSRALGLAVAASIACAVGAAPAVADAPWGFEQVTPVVKGGGAVQGTASFQSSPDGNAFLYSTTAPFESLPAESSPAYTRYLGVRGPDAWVGRAEDVPFGVGTGAATAVFGIATVIGSSNDLSYALVASTVALTPGATKGGGNLYMRDMRSGALTLVATSSNPSLAAQGTTTGGSITAKYVAPDGRAAMFVSTAALVPGAPDVDITGAATLYSWTASDGVRAVSVLPDDQGGAIVGTASSTNNSETGTRDSVPHGDGLAHVYFQSVVNNQAGAAYVRTGGVTRAISVSHIPGDPATPVNARIDAVGDGGRYALVHTIGVFPLTPDTPTPPVLSGAAYAILYRYDATDGSLAYVGTLDNDQGSGVLQMTQDGQTVAFQSRFALTGAAVLGEANMYVWRDGSLRFVETAEASSGASNESNFLRLLSPNGRYLSFTDSSSSVAQRFGADNVSPGCPLPVIGGAGPCDEVYLFDADADNGAGRLSCVSCRTDGAPPKGASGDPGNSAIGFTHLNSHQMQTVVDDGTVFFTSADELLPSDADGANDVYASKDGHLRLISRATQGTSARFLDASPDGRTVFIATNDAIVPTDVDRAVDVYMTRAGAGFPYTAPVVAPPCSGGDCRDASAPPVAPPPAGSVMFAGPGNVVAEAPAVRVPSSKVSVSKVKAIVGASGSLRVKVPGKGRLTASGSGVKRVKKSVSKAATYTIKVSLSASAQRALKKSRSLKKKVRIAFTPSGGRASTVTVSLTYKSPSSKKKGR